MISRAPLVLDSEMLDEARTFLRLEEADLDPSLGGVILSAVAAAEDFLNLMLLRRSVTETMAASTGWQRLGTAPVTAISAVELVDPSGTAVPVAPGDHAIDIDGSGAGWVRIVHPPPRARIRIGYTAGMATAWSVLPEAIRLGVLRLAGYIFGHRDGADDPGPPASVVALLKPWRRIRLS